MRHTVILSATTLLALSCAAQNAPSIFIYPNAGSGTAAPFLQFTPDARAAGMGHTGVASSPDVNSIHWNSAKLAFAPKQLEASVSYTPWLNTARTNLAHASAYIRPDDRNAFGMSVRHFLVTPITLTDQAGNPLGQFRTNEWAGDLAYARRLGKCFSAGIAARYIYSNLTSGITIEGFDSRPGTSVSFDLGGYYCNEEKTMWGKKATVTAGLTVTNIGPKISYFSSASHDPLPASLRAGGGLSMELNETNRLAFQLEANKLLVPVQGGFSKKMQDLSPRFGTEYSFRNLVSVRCGYAYSNPDTGSNSLVTFGGGINYKDFIRLDGAYQTALGGANSNWQELIYFTLRVRVCRMQG